MLKKLILSICLVSLTLFAQSILTFSNEIANNNIDHHSKLSFETPDYDFGKVFRGEKVEHLY